MKFLDLADGGQQLAPLLSAHIDSTTLLVAVPPGGLPVGAAVADALGCVVVPLHVERDHDGVRVELALEVAGRHVMVIDDGVETGTAARAVVAALREAGAVHVVLAVPVCPRDSEVGLRQVYDDVIAVTRPLVRRSLRWHYESFA